jgi:hypothetical protein
VWVLNKSNWRETAELIGIASIVASLIFVGLELRQSQIVAVQEAMDTRAGWFMANRASVNDHADIWLKGNSGAELTAVESVIYANLVRDLHTNNSFTFSRERRLGFDGYEYAAHELAWFLHQNPPAREQWEMYIDNRQQMREMLMPRSEFGSNNFAAVVRADLRKLAEAANSE